MLKYFVLLVKVREGRKWHHSTIIKKKNVKTQCLIKRYMVINERIKIKWIILRRVIEKPPYSVCKLSFIGTSNGHFRVKYTLNNPRKLLSESERQLLPQLKHVRQPNKPSICAAPKIALSSALVRTQVDPWDQWRTPQVSEDNTTRSYNHPSLEKHHN